MYKIEKQQGYIEQGITAISCKYIQWIIKIPNHYVVHLKYYKSSILHVKKQLKYYKSTIFHTKKQMKYHLTPIRKTIKKKKIKCFSGCGEKEILCRNIGGNGN